MTDRSPLPGLKILLMGGPGSGKTYAIRTWLDAGITPIGLFTENSFDVLGDVPKEKLPWRYVPPTSGTLQTLIDASRRVSTMNADQIQKSHDMTRSSSNQYMPMLEALASFECQRTGLKLGNAGEWGTDKALCLDSLSGLTIAATKLAVGEKYAMTQPEFQIAMKTIENLVIQLCTGFQCHVLMTAHLERETDEVNGGVKIYPSTLGKKLAPVLGRYFTDVIMAKRLGTKFIWDTADTQADLKARNFSIASELPPSVAPGVAKWKTRGGTISPTA